MNRTKASPCLLRRGVISSLLVGGLGAPACASPPPAAAENGAEQTTVPSKPAALYPSLKLENFGYTPLLVPPTLRLEGCRPSLSVYAQVHVDHDVVRLALVSPTLEKLKPSTSVSWLRTFSFGMKGSLAPKLHVEVYREQGVKPYDENIVWTLTNRASLCDLLQTGGTAAYLSPDRPNFPSEKPVVAPFSLLGCRVGTDGPVRVFPSTLLLRVPTSVLAAGTNGNRAIPIKIPLQVFEGPPLFFESDATQTSSNQEPGIASTIDAPSVVAATLHVGPAGAQISTGPNFLIDTTLAFAWKQPSEAQPPWFMHMLTTLGIDASSPDVRIAIRSGDAFVASLQFRTTHQALSRATLPNWNPYESARVSVYPWSAP